MTVVVRREIIAACPSFEAFTPAWWAVGPHAQSLAQACKPEPASKYRRELFTLPFDGVQVGLDWKETEAMADDTPLILCLHGLGGDRDSRYQQVFTDIALRRGFRTVVFNRRGHGDVSLLPVDVKGAILKAPCIFPRHNNMDDMMAVVEYITGLYPKAEKYMVGFSCGANLCINYLAATGEQCPFKAGVSISNGYDIWAGTSSLRSDTIADGVATQFIKDILLQGRLAEAKELAGKAGLAIDFEQVMKTRSLQDLEELLVVPAYGLASLKDYYAEDSCSNTIKDVKSPLLCIAAKHDPLVDELMTTVPVNAAKDNENILAVVTQHGGHVGWIEQFREDPWYVNLVFEYYDAVSKQSSKAAAATDVVVQVE